MHTVQIYLVLLHYHRGICTVGATDFVSLLLLFVFALTNTLLSNVLDTQFPRNHWLKAVLAAPGIIIGLGLFEANTILFATTCTRGSHTKTPSSTGTTGVRMLEDQLLVNR